MTLTDLHLTESVARGLDRLGWPASAPLLRDIAPTVARGHNLVVVVPPAPVYATPVLAGLFSRHFEPGTDALVLAPPGSLAEWGVPVGALAPGGTLNPLLVLGPGQAARRLRGSPSGNLIIASPATALDLRRRSLTRAESVGVVVIAWPESWEDRDVLSLLLQEVPREAQRVILTSAPAEIAALIEGHAWRALTVGATVQALRPGGPVKTVALAWSRRVAAIAELAEALDAASLTVWTADASRHAELERAVAGLGVPVTVTSGDAPPAAEVIAFDPPSPDRLTQLLTAGQVTLLMPPGSEAYLARIAGPRRALLLPGELDAASSDASRRRGLIERALQEQPLEGELAILAPLFERHNATSVAAAIYQLWATEARKPARPVDVQARGIAKIWVGAGRQDEVGPNDLVGLLVNELHVERSHIGKIELRDAFSLIEVPAEDAERIAQAMAGRTVRRKRLTARVDRKPAGGPGKRPPRRP